MKMQKWLIQLMVVMVLISSCSSSNSDFKTTKSGLGYKIFSGNSKDSLKPGDLFRLRITNKIEDSMLTVPGETPDQFWKADSTAPEFSLFEVIKFMSVGDSAVIRFPVDSIIKKQGSAPYPFMKPGKNMYVTLKILKKYKSEPEARAEYDSEMARMNTIFMAKDSVNRIKSDAEFTKITAEKFAGAVKTPGGTLVQIIKQGDGPACDSGKLISMKYEGSLTNGKVFDGNMNVKDPAQAMPLEFVIGTRSVIPGWDQGIMLLKKGAKAKLFVPAMQGYGPQPDERIPAYSNLLFDVEVVDVKDAPKQNLPPPPPPVNQ